MSINGKRKPGPLRDTVEEAAEDAQRMLRERSSAGMQRRRVTLQDGYDLLVKELDRLGRRDDTFGYYERGWSALTRTPPKGWSPEFPLADLDVDQVYRYAKRRTDAGVQPSTVWSKEIQALKRITALARKRKLIRKDPFEDLEAPTIRSKRFESFPAATIQELFTKVRESDEGRRSTRLRDALVIEGVFLSGMRRAEFARLKVEDLDIDNRRLYVDGKVRDRYLPLGTRLIEVLRELADGKQPEAPLSCSRKAIEALFYRWQKRLGVKISPHKMRHSMATSAVEAGVDIFRLADLLGHSNINQTRKYFHAADQRQRDALDAIADHHLNGGAPKKTDEDQGHSGSSSSDASA